MRILSPTQRSFAKAASHGALRLFNENAAKITGAIGIACDAMLSSYNYLKHEKISIDFSQPTSDQLLSLSGMTYFAAGMLFFGADRHPWLKKPTGLLTLGGAGFAAAAGHASNTPEFYGAAAAEALTGLSFMFESHANKLAGKIKNADDTWLSYFGKMYLDHPVASMAVIQALGAVSAIAAGINNPDQRLMIPYGLMWLAASATMVATDNGVKKKIAGIYEPANENTPTTPAMHCR